jgi:hypothetical protein
MAWAVNNNELMKGKGNLQKKTDFTYGRLTNEFKKTGFLKTRVKTVPFKSSSIFKN